MKTVVVVLFLVSILCILFVLCGPFFSTGCFVFFLLIVGYFSVTFAGKSQINKQNKTQKTKQYVTEFYSYIFVS